MNAKLTFKITGYIFLIVAAFMVLPMIVAFIYGEGDWKWFLITGAGSAVIGFLLQLLKPKRESLYTRDGLIVAGLAWLAMSLVGAVPFVLSGTIPNYIDALFESVSGFTTSGISIIADVEIVGHSMLFWRSLTHWLGGMGVLVFMLAIAPVAGGTSMQIMRAESPGPSTDKVSPKISQTAKILYLVYIAFTLAEIIALVIAGLSFFHAVLISFGTMATGGFSYLNTSLATFTAAQQIIVIVFMILAGVNFSLYFMIIRGKAKKALKDSELRWYLLIMLIAVVLITVNVFASRNQFDTWSETVRQTIFAGASAMTSTGFAAHNYNMWPWFSKIIIILVMFIGGCAGSTGGGIKVSRNILMFKSIRKFLKEKNHPRSVNIVSYNKQEVNSQIISGVYHYFAIVLVITLISVILVSIDPRMDLTTSLANVATTINNNGIEIRTAADITFATSTWWAKIIYIINMLIGRLEIFPILVLFAVAFSPVKRISRTIKRKAE